MCCTLARPGSASQTAPKRTCYYNNETAYDVAVRWWTLILVESRYFKSKKHQQHCPYTYTAWYACFAAAVEFIEERLQNSDRRTDISLSRPALHEAAKKSPSFLRIGSARCTTLVRVTVRLDQSNNTIIVSIVQQLVLTVSIG